MPCGTRPGLVVVGALVESPVINVPALGRASGCYGCARAPHGGGLCLVSIGGGAWCVRAPCGAHLGLVVVGALVVGPVADPVGLGRA